MSSAKSLTALAIALVLGSSQQVLAQEQEEDSAYQWGRWAVLSPAAGGEPYRAPLTPDAANNLRPGDAFGPELASIENGPQPPIIDDPGDRPPPPPPPGINDPGDRLPPPPPPS